MDHRESGATLPLVLIMMAILTGMATSVLSGSRQELRMSRAYLHSTQAFYAAMAGIQWIAAQCGTHDDRPSECVPGKQPPQQPLASQSTFQVTAASCTSSPECQGADGVLVTSIGCTGQPTGPPATCDSVAADQGRRVLRAIVQIRDPGDQHYKVSLRLLP